MLRHSLWAAASGIFVTASRFVLTAVLARRLSTDLFGQYAYTQWLADIGFLVCAFGATGVASRYFAEYRHQPMVLAAIVRRWRPFSLALPVIGAAAATCGAHLSGLSLKPEDSVLLLCWGTATGVWGMHMAALSGLQRFDLVFRSNVLASMIMLAGAAIIPLDGELTPLFAVMAVATVVAAAVGTRCIAAFSRGEAAVLEAGKVRQIYRYSFNIWLCLLYTSPSPRDGLLSRMPSSA